jgi:hypothetical protein
MVRYDCNAKTPCTLEQPDNDEDRVSLPLRNARRISCLPDMEVRVSNMLYRTMNRNEPLNNNDRTGSSPLYGKRCMGERYPHFEILPYRRKVPRAGRVCVADAPCASKVEDVVMRSEQLVRNTLHSGTSGGSAASEHRAGRSRLLAYRFELLQAVVLSAQLASAQNDHVLRLRIR